MATPSKRSDALDLSESNVKVIIHRARRRYRDLLKEEVARTVERKDEIDDELKELFDTIQEFERRQREAHESLERRYPRPRLGHRILALRNTSALGALLMGPAGWVIAAMLIVWETLVR